MEHDDKIKKQNFLQQLRYYQGKYFVGVTTNGKTQYLQVNKGGYELSNTPHTQKTIILKYDDIESENRMQEIANSPFHYCYKIDCNEHLFGYTPKQPFWKLLIEYLRKLWTDK